MTDETDDALDPQVIAQAREMGWQPLDKFKGNKDKWVDADVFVERGQHVLPIVRAERDRLRGDLLTRDQKIGTLERQLNATQALVKDLGENFEKVLTERLAQQRSELKAQLKDAVADRDVEAELNIREQLDNLTTAENDAKKRQQSNREKLNPEPTADAPTAPTPEFAAWHKDNKWFGEDKKRTKELLRIGEDLRDEGETLEGRAFMDKCLEVLEEREAERDGGQRPTSKVEGGNPRGRTGGVDGGYSSLPAEAKAACDADEETFVGEGKMFKDKKSWQAYYVKMYHGS